jgi:hypothetical protein
VPGGETQHQPAVRGHERIAVDVTPELIAVGMLAPLVLEGDLPFLVAEIGVDYLPAPPVVNGQLDLGVGQIAR